MARPLLHGVRRAHPGAEIRALGPAPLIALLGAESTFDAGLAWPARRGPEGSGAARAGMARLAADLRAWRPDASLVLPFSFSSAWFAWRTRAALRIGYARGA